MIYGISGKRGAGKTTLAEIMAVKYGWRHISFAGALKDMVMRDFGLTWEHVHGKLKESPISFYPKGDGTCFTPREILIASGQFYRQFDPLYWVRRALTSVDAGDRIVVSDVRFQNEADHIRAFGGQIVRLERHKHLNIYQGDIEDVSETDLDHYRFDVIVPADGNETMQDLESVADYLNRSVPR